MNARCSPGQLAAPRTSIHPFIYRFERPPRAALGFYVGASWRNPPAPPAPHTQHPHNSPWALPRPLGPFPGPSAPSRAGRSRGGPGPAVGRAPGLPKCVMAGPSPPPPPAARWPAPGGRRRLRALRDCGAEGSGGSSAPLLACSYQKQALGNNFFPFSYSFPPPSPFSSHFMAVELPGTQPAGLHADILLSTGK